MLLRRVIIASLIFVVSELKK
jgi:hypothetical protein